MLKKCESHLQMQKLLTFFSKNISIYAIIDYQSFNDTLTNDIDSFEQLGLKFIAKPFRKHRNYTCKRVISQTGQDKIKFETCESINFLYA